MSHVFCNRTLNLRNIKAIGYDMDYTIVNYHSERWEERAYDYLKQYFLNIGWPVQNLEFDPTVACRGLMIDQEKGNLVKANRFGFIKLARHGTRSLDLSDIKKNYSRTIIDLSEKRWVFLNTLFSLSEGCIYAQLVDLLDQKQIPQTLGYADLYQQVYQVLEAAHMEGELKNDIMADPDRYVKLDPKIPLTLLDQFYAGKKLMLITNSEWPYAQHMMQYTFDRYLPTGMTWKDLFEIIIVSARKPSFFTSVQPLFEIITDSGLLRPYLSKLKRGTCFLGGSALHVEEALRISGDEILYIGDHMFSDVQVTKNVLRWRTGLILKELDQELEVLNKFKTQEELLQKLMQAKENLENQHSVKKLIIQRIQHQYDLQANQNIQTLEKECEKIKHEIEHLDETIKPIATLAAQLHNPNWGLLMRAGNDKSYLAYQMERYADIYAGSVSDLLKITPFCYLRSQRGQLPHESQ
jgi:5'-nucleotidase